MELGKTVRSVIALEYAEGIEADTARRLSELWGRRLLRTPELREVAAGLIANTQGRQWCQMMLDKGWSIRRAAEVLREAGADVPEACMAMNRWARRPDGAPEERTAAAETAEEIEHRCRGAARGRGEMASGGHKEDRRGAGVQARGMTQRRRGHTRGAEGNNDAASGGSGERAEDEQHARKATRAGTRV